MAKLNEAQQFRKYATLLNEDTVDPARAMEIITTIQQLANKFAEVCQSGDAICGPLSEDLAQAAIELENLYQGPLYKS